MKNTLLYVLILLGVGIFGFMLFSTKEDCSADTCDVDLETTSDTSSLTKNVSVKAAPDTTMNKEEAVATDEMIKEGDSVQTDVSKGSYLPYTASALTQAQEDGRTLLFFHADWCPTCRSADGELTKSGRQLPEDLTVLKVNYDTEKDLKAKYNVVSQHAFVQIDENGAEITKWSGGGLAEIIEYIEEV